MIARRRRNLLSALGLILLAVVAIGLSLMALFQNQLVIAEPATTVSSRPTPVSSGVPSASPSSNGATSSPASTAEPTPSPQKSTPADTESTPADTESTAKRVVVLGDRYSADGAPGVWVKTVETELNWASVTNLSAAGRGYIEKPRPCDTRPCTNFEGAISAVVEADPDVVFTFGGAADNDNDLSAPAEDYYAALREELPDAQLVAISPVTTEDAVPYWMRLHDRAIRDGVEAVGGTFVDVGQPGVGDGVALSAEAQADVAKAIVDELS